MRKEDSDDLIKKYLAAETTLEEEETLFESKNQLSEIAEWSTYVKQKRKKAPAHINDSILASIQARKRQQVVVGLSGIAASIALVIAFFIYNTGMNSLTYEEKEVRLKEALSMFSDETHAPVNHSVLYEDDMVIIYTASK